MAENFDDETEVVTETTKKTVSRTTPSAVQTSVRVQSRRAAKSGMLDTPEIIALSASSAALLAVILAYFFWLLPARAEFVKLETERGKKVEQLANLQKQADQTRTNAAGFVDLMTSVNRFETNYLPVAALGNAALYKRLNDLIRANNLRNTAGPEYAPLEAVEASRNKLAKGQSLFPGTGVTVTVEGSYANLRRFIGELENTKQVLVINAVEIESSNESSGSSTTVDRAPNKALPKPGIPNGIPNGIPGAPPVNQPQSPNGFDNADSAAARSAAPAKPRNVVSLRLQMAAYFRRAEAQSPAASN